MSDFYTSNPGRGLPSKDYSVNGDYSLKLTPTSGEYSLYGIEYDFENGKRYLLEVCCLNNISGATIEIRNSDGDRLFILSIPVTSDFHYYSLEFTSTGIESKITFRTYNSENSLYMDNIRLISL